ncbi:MAG: ParB/RepB/Spo0J family partition protein [Clostridium sp.]|nr:ParB/RepB/Spo0J family partition protein [Clostridium sp.]
MGVTTNWNEEDKWDLIVSYPPLEGQSKYKFFKWLKSALTPKGHAILVLPKGFFATKHSKIVDSLLPCFQVAYKEELTEKLVKSTTEDEIVIVEFTEAHRKLIFRGKDVSTTSTDEIPEKQDNKNASRKVVPMFVSHPSSDQNDEERVHHISLDRIDLNPNNPRTKEVTEQEIEELAHTIDKHGLLEPILLNDKGERYEIIFGERRYLACKKLALPTIKAFVKRVSTEVALEIALIENLQRKDITPLEEANAFSKVMELCGYTIPELAFHIGRSDMYVRSRIALLSLQSKFQQLVEEGKLSLASAYELSKYGYEVQRNLFKEYFDEEKEGSWLYISTKELKKRLEENFMADLDLYEFDKRRCLTCPYNSANKTLFKDFYKPQCLNIQCLHEKKNSHLKQVVQEIKKKKDSVEFYTSPNEELSRSVKNEFKEVKINVLQTTPIESLVAPIEPKKANFDNPADYEEAHRQYLVDSNDFEQEMSSLEGQIQEGKLKKIFYISQSGGRTCYVPVVKMEEPVETEESLKKKDRFYKDLCIEGMLKESFAFFQKKELPETELSEVEEELMTYVLIPYAKKEHYPMISLRPGETIDDESQYDSFQKLSKGQTNMLRRDFIFHHLKKAKGNSKRTMMLMRFIEHHYPEKFSRIKDKWMKEYQDQSQKIKKKLKQLQQEKEKNETQKAKKEKVTV